MRNLALVVLLSGCSLLKTQNPSAPPADPACRTSRGPVVIDFVLAGIGAPVAAITAYGIVGDDPPMISGAMLGTLAAFVGSAVVGMIRTNRCRNAYDSVNGAVAGR